MRIAKYLDALQLALGVTTDKDVAAKMGWSHSMPSHWRKGRRFMDNQTAGAVSALIGVPVIHIIAAAEADREEVTGQRSFWTDFFTRTAATSVVLLLAVVTNFVTPSPAHADQPDAAQQASLSYVKLHKRIHATLGAAKAATFTARLRPAARPAAATIQTAACTAFSVTPA